MWPAISKEKDILKAYQAGTNVIRFNFSHAQYEPTLKIVDIINSLNNSGQTNLSYLLDTKWPEIRVWDLEKPFKYKKS